MADEHRPEADTPLLRAESTAHSEGALMRPVARGTGVSGALWERQGMPSARRLNRTALAVAGAAALLLGTTTAAYGRQAGYRHRR